MSNSKARKGQSLEQILSETLEPVSHCASDCVACHSSHRLLYDQTHVLRGSLVFMESCTIFRCAKSIQTDRNHPQYSLLWVSTDRQIPIQLGYRLGTRQIQSRASFSITLLYRQIDQMQGQLFSFLTIQIDSDTMSVDGVVFMFPSISVPVAFILLIALCCLSYTYMYAACLFTLIHACVDLRQPIIGLYSLSYMTAFTHWVFLNTHPFCYHMSYFR